MEQVVLKPHNLLGQLRILASDSPAQEESSIFDLFQHASQDDPLPGKILEAIPRKDHLKENTVAQCTEEEGQVWYREKLYLPEGDQLRLKLIQEHYDTALA
jgi:hypothetical protein